MVLTLDNTKINDNSNKKNKNKTKAWWMVVAFLQGRVQ